MLVLSGQPIGEHEDAHKQTEREWFTDFRVKGLAAAANISLSGITNAKKQADDIGNYILAVVHCIQVQQVDGVANPSGCPPMFKGL